ncbi:uncharacterized protein LOC141595279 [Silene latifolia]|uniref:uncharacterized protein LOC141595279 n=1 Tax=Silene latifolia TaxID=37657 RepID=UPI003D77486F
MRKTRAESQQKLVNSITQSENGAQEREPLWEDLRSYSTQMAGPWIVCGDFNSILNVGERIGGAVVTRAEMASMRDIVEYNQLQELKLNRAYYTWNNKHEASSKVYSKLDRNGPRQKRNVKKESIDLIKARDMYLAHKAKETWVKEGDSNTTFFHSTITRRRTRNRVFQIKDQHINLCCTPETVKLAFEQYYIELLGTSKQVKPIHCGVVSTCNCLSSEHKIILSATVTDEEIKQAMFSIDGTESPGPDGYGSQFLKDA